MTPHSATTSAGARRSIFKRLLAPRTRRGRWTRRGVVLLALLAGVAWGVLRGPGARWIVMPRLREALGPGARAEGVAIHLDGSATLRGLTLPATGVAGPAGEPVRVELCRVAMKRGAGVSTADLTIEGGRVRVSQDVERGTLNLGALEVLAMEPAAGTTRLRITVRGLHIEVGEHQGAEYRPLKSITVDGSLTPASEPGRAAFQLTQRSEGERQALVVRGEITPEGAEAELQGLNLSDWPASVIPSPVRGVYAQLDVRGEIGRTVLLLHDGGRIEARTLLRGVDVSLPFDLEGTMRPVGPLARMRGVEGEIAYDGAGVTARLSGRLEDFPYEADLHYDGATADAPFRCTLRTRDYRLTREAPLVPYAPAVVAERLRTFTQPTGILDADVLVERLRRPDGSVGPVDVSGTIEIRDGVASFINFPYEFRQMSGRFRFDNSVILIEDIRGVSASGARLHATGEIAPPVDDGRVDLHVRAEGVPIDETLRAGLRGRARLYDALFSDERLAELADAGLIETEGPGAFIPGGTCDVDVYVTRELGGDSIWDYLVGVSVPEVDLLAERFPYPIRARDVVLRVDPLRAEVLRGSFFGLHGGEASVGARADLDDSNDVALRVIGRHFPIDELLVHAAAVATGQDEAEAARLARELGLSGRADPDIFVRVGEGETITIGGFVAGRGLRAAPGPHAPALAFEGELDLNAMQARAAGLIEPPADAPTPGLSFDGALAPPPTTFEARVEFGGGATELAASIAHLDLALTLEDLLRPLAPEAAEELASLRGDVDPQGLADVHGTLVLPEEGAARAMVEVSPRAMVSLDSDFGRIALREPQGQVRLEDGAVEVQSLSGRLTINDRPAAWVELGGVIRGEAPGVRIEARQIDLAHPAWTEMARLSAGEEAATTLSEFALRGEGAGSLWLEPEAAGPWQVRSAALRPSRVTFARRGVDVVLTAMHGSLDYALGESLAFALQGQSPAGDWRATAAGAATFGDTQTRVDASITLEAQDLAPELRALLPQDIDEAASELGLTARGLHLDLPTLVLSWDEAGERTTARGVVQFEEASFDVGIEIAEARGLAAFVVVSGSPPEVRLELTQARAAGVTLGRTLARVVRDDAGVRAEFETDAHAGRISGEARVLPEPARYEADVRFAGLLLAPLLRDLEATAEAPTEDGAPGDEREPVPTAAATPTEASAARAPQGDGVQRSDARQDDAETGRVSGELTLSGLVGEVASRRGRGRLLVGEGRVLDMPLVLPLLKVGNLQLPTRGTIDLAMASFYLDGSLITFDELSAFADSVEIFGYGTMTLPGRELDLWFNSRALRPIPIISGVVESLRRGLVTARITGPLGKQRVSTDALPGTRALLDRLFTGPATPEEQHLARIEARSRENRDRVRRAGERVRRLAEAAPTEGTHP